MGGLPPVVGLGAAVVLSAAASWFGLTSLALVTALFAHVLAAGLMVLRAGRSPDERSVWVRWAGAACAAAVGGLLVQVGAPAVAAVLLMAVFPLATEQPSAGTGIPPRWPTRTS